MTRAEVICAAVVLAFATATVDAAPRKAKPFTMGWFGVGVGMVSGSVELPCVPDDPGSDCGESGLFPSYHVDVTVAGPVGFRLRGVRAEEDTRHKPRELAAMVGFQTGRKWYLYVGYGSIRHADNEYDGNAAGFAWEFVHAGRDRDNLGSQWSIMGNHGKDVSYVGISVGFRLGDLR